MQNVNWRLRGRWLVIFGVVAVLGCSDGALDGDGDAVARIGDKVVSEEEFQRFVETLPSQWQTRVKTPSGRKQIAEHMVRAKLIELEAENRGIHEQPQIRQQLEQARQRILLQALMKEWQESFEIPESQVRDFYEKNRDRYQHPERFHSRHILIKLSSNAESSEVERARQRALEAKRRVEQGESFAAVAKDMSQGPSAPRGGDLGFVERGRFHPEYEKAALSLQPGELSDPVRTPFGWHVIRLEKVEEAGEEAYKEVRDQIRQELLPRQRQQAFESFMSDLREQYDVEIFEAQIAKAVDTEAKPEAKPSESAAPSGQPRTVPEQPVAPAPSAPSPQTED